MSKVKNKSHKSLLFVAISILLSFLFIKLFDYALGFTLSSTASSFSNNRYVNLREHNPNSKIFPPLSVCSVLNLDKPVGIHSNSKGFLESNHVLNEGLKYKKIGWSHSTKKRFISVQFDGFDEHWVLVVWLGSGSGLIYYVIQCFLKVIFC